MRFDVPQKIKPATRRDITDYLSAEGINWSGRLEEPAFVGRVWDLSRIRSTDRRFSDAAGDIHQHRVNNWDWPDDWIFDDARFNLQASSDETFVRFLAQMLHPVVREDEEEVARLLEFFNEVLARDDWELVEVAQLSGRPVYEGRRREAIKAPTDALELERYKRLDDPQVLRDHLRRIDRDLQTDPAGAIASSKELVETILRLILEDYEVETQKGEGLPDLYKKVQKALRLNAEDVPESRRGSEATVKTLRSLVTAIQGLAELRNELGLGHGRARRSPAVSRHGRLAFNAAVTVSEFLLDTWHVRRNAEES